MDPAHDTWAQIRQLRSEVGRYPWLQPRLADLLRRVGREAEALELLRESVQSHADYISGWVILGEAQQQAGRRSEALRAWGQAGELVPGAHASWQHILDAERVDEQRYETLLKRVWKQDVFSMRHLRDLEQRDLLDASDYQQALRPTKPEAARREEVFQRLIERTGESGSVDEAPESSPTEETPSDPVAVTGEETRNAPAAELDKPPFDERTSPPAVDDEAQHQASPVPAEDKPDPRQELLQQQAKRLEVLTRPPVPHSPVPVVQTPDRVTGPSGMQTRALARIYLDQGYSRLALQVLQELLNTAPADRGLIAMRREAKRQLAEKREALQASRTRKGGTDGDA